jgi:type II secretory pathway pseudopilin PulG
LIELLVVIAIIALLIGILLPALGKSRQQGRLTQCLGRMQQIGVAANSYAVTFQDRVVSFTWTRSMFAFSPFTDAQPDATLPGGGQAYSTDIMAGRAQALDFIHRKTGLAESQISAVTNWIPHIIYNHLALAEQQDWKLPSVEFTCPEDANRIGWQKSWQRFSTGSAQPQPIGSDSNPQLRRWFVSASYNFVPAALGFDRDVGTKLAILNQGDHRTYRGFQGGDGSNDILGKRKITDVSSPASKVYVYDQESRHDGRRPYHCVYPEARQPLLLFDGHVKMYRNGTPVTTGVTLAYGAQRRGEAVNPGWNPSGAGPNSAVNFNYNYVDPENWEAPLRDGSRTGSNQVIGYYRYTRGGLRGVDVEQPEVDAR